MKVLVINCGSSSIKFQLINMENQDVIAKGLVERIGLPGAQLIYKYSDQKVVAERDIADHGAGIELIVEHLTSDECGVIKDKGEIYAIGHRVVHGAEKFNSTVEITDEVVETLNECIPLAPLHNPPNIIGIEACRKVLPGIPMGGVFDTAFHQSMPKKAYMYPLPYEVYEKHGVRRYGFHGTSHFFVAKEGAKLMGKDIKDMKIITCHLGNGSSVTAIDGGKSVDTSMGFTPLPGLMMGTRCGDIDPAIPIFLQNRADMSAAEVDALLNKQSGIHGISGISSDMRDIEEKYNEGNERAILAVDMMVYRIKKYIGSYIAAMNGVDLIIFTAGIGENDALVRSETLKNMEFLGIDFDAEANDKRFGEPGTISKDSSKVKVMVIPTNEELEIAEQTVEVLKK